DPFSYPVSSFNQIAKTDLAGHDKLSWDEALRAVERQDPHIVFLASADTTDEMQIMLRLAETGRFVLTSLHANDATSAYWVCFQREVYSYALASVLAGVVHCRLAKKLCNSCKTEVQPDQTALVKVGITSSDIKGKTFYYAPGCADCDNLGTSGRVGVYEVLELHDHLKGMIETKEASSSFRQAAIDSGMMTLKAAALRKAAAGIISLEEVIDLVS
ncbi:MAG: Flp pilus assembly complex ATPase component TadA, partial [Candidatus Lindowbacteria bacterium]|nr:Flp pilus assembly complex ATPase component TadA [Candidatus Lindowbacteria bacterium]